MILKVQYKDKMGGQSCLTLPADDVQSCIPFVNKNIALPAQRKQSGRLTDYNTETETVQPGKKGKEKPKK